MDYSFAKIDKNDFTTKFLPYIPSFTLWQSWKLIMYNDNEYPPLQIVPFGIVGNCRVSESGATNN